MIAKGDSKRLRNKNKLKYIGKPMFLWNIKKGLRISKNFYFNSDDEEMLRIASKTGLKQLKEIKNYWTTKLLQDLFLKAVLNLFQKQ